MILNYCVCVFILVLVSTGNYKQINYYLKASEGKVSLAQLIIAHGIWENE